MTAKATEDKILSFIFYVGFLLLDRFIHRIVLFAIPTLFIFLVYEPARSYESAFFVTMISMSLVWAVFDLARGIELDHEHKDVTLRDLVIQKISD